MPGDPVAAALLMAAPLGVLGVFALALADRMVPLLPSPGLFTAIGVAAAEGVWCLPLALAASIIGSGTGALSAFNLGAAARRRESRRVHTFLRRRDRWGRALRTLHRTGSTFPLTAQLLPATRLVVPLLGGAVSHDKRRFLLSTGAGIAIWNTGFIALGFAVFHLGGSVNLTVLSLILSAVAMTATLAMRSKRGRAVRSPYAAWPRLS